MSLYQQYLNYLNQALPNISGIFASTPAQAMEETTEETVAQPVGITPQLLQLTGGGDNFSVYNPDPTRTRTDYINPFPFNVDDNLGTSDYGYQRAGIPGLVDLASNYLQNSLLGRGLAAARNMLPVNSRGILENELIGQGVMLDDIGRIVSNNYNTPEGIMAGYNAAKMDASTFDDRIANIEKTIARKTAADPNYDPSNLQNRIDLINQAKDIFLGAKKSSGVIEDQKLREKGLTPLTDQIAMNQEKLDFQQLASSKDEDDTLDDFISFTGKPTGIMGTPDYGYLGVPNRNIVNEKAVQDAIDRGRERDIQRQIEMEEMAKKKRDIQQYTGGGGDNNSGGRGFDREDRGPGASSRGGTSATDSDLGNLGFSDIRLKENIELIGKSSSNINIYKFNYKDNPTTYQGVMAHEVPWASIKHSNGYMMVDYNKIDVEFKKWQR